MALRVEDLGETAGFCYSKDKWEAVDCMGSRWPVIAVASASWSFPNHIENRRQCFQYGNNKERITHKKQQCSGSGANIALLAPSSSLRPTRNKNFFDP